MTSRGKKFPFMKKGARWAKISVSKPGEYVPPTNKHTREAALVRHRKSADASDIKEDTSTEAYHDTNPTRRLNRHASFPTFEIIEKRTSAKKAKNDERLEQQTENLGYDSEQDNDNNKSFERNELNMVTTSDSQQQFEKDTGSGGRNSDIDDSLFQPLPSLEHSNRARSDIFQEQRRERNLEIVQQDYPHFMIPVRSRQEQQKRTHQEDQDGIVMHDHIPNSIQDMIPLSDHSKQQTGKNLYGELDYSTDSSCEQTAEEEEQAYTEFQVDTLDEDPIAHENHDDKREISESEDDWGSLDETSSVPHTLEHLETKPIQANIQANTQERSPNAGRVADDVPPAKTRNASNFSRGRLSRRRNTSGHKHLGNVVDEYFLSEQNERTKRDHKLRRIKERKEREEEWQELKRKEEDLNEQLAFFKLENEKLRKARDELSVSKQQLENERIEFERHVDQEMSKMKQLKEAEMSKIAREKKIMGRQHRAATAFSARKELEKQIDELQEKLENCKTSTKRRDAKHRTEVDRLRQTVKELRLRINELEEQLKQIELQRIDEIISDKKNRYQPSTHGSVENKIPLIDAPKGEDRLITQEKLMPGEISQIEFQQHMFGEDSDIEDHHDSHEVNTDDEGDRSLEKVPDQIEVEELNQDIVDRHRWIDIAGHVRNLCITLPCDDYKEEPDAWFHDLESPEIRQKDKIVARVKNSGGREETRHASGKRVISYPNRTMKIIFPDSISIVTFSNGDVKKVYPDGRIVYFYSVTSTLQISYPHGVEVFRFENGQTERFFPDGTKEIIFPGGVTHKYISPDGHEQIEFVKEGIMQLLTPDGTRIIRYPDGSMSSAKRIDQDQPR